MTSYYDGPDLEATVLDALRSAGRDVEAIDSDDLAGLDEFHALGRAGTLALAQLARIAPGERVLDVGAGIGGPARALARHFDVHVTAVDPTARFARLAASLTARSGLSRRVTVVQADGATLPFPAGAFDVVWTLAVWQSVEDKDALAREVRRVLAPTGRVAMLELVGDGRDLDFPVPWGDSAADSFVPTEAGLRSVLERAGLRVDHWLTGDAAQAALAEAAGDPDRMTIGLPGVGLDLLMPDHDERLAGLVRNVEDGRVRVVLAVLSPAARRNGRTP
jgi:SAM-dependent methyltransferase